MGLKVIKVTQISNYTMKSSLVTLAALIATTGASPIPSPFLKGVANPLVEGDSQTSDIQPYDQQDDSEVSEYIPQSDNSEEIHDDSAGISGGGGIGGSLDASLGGLGGSIGGSIGRSAGLEGILEIEGLGEILEQLKSLLTGVVGTGVNTGKGVVDTALGLANKGVTLITGLANNVLGSVDGDHTGEAGLGGLLSSLLSIPKQLLGGISGSISGGVGGGISVN